jgi:ubiquinone/menaquinone biosynthesis C-methylase UbiE
MRLLKPELLIKTGEVDHADWNYRPVLGWIERVRFSLVITLLNEVKCHCLLEVGYGSGILMPELSRYCDELSGIDIHDKAVDIQKVLDQNGVKTKLYTGTIEKSILPGNYYDYVVAVSALEFVHNISAACQEIRRILKPEGFLIVVTPGRSKMLDFGLKILTGESAEHDFENRRELLLPTLMENFTLTQSLIVPPIIGHLVPLYIGLKLSPIKTK